MPVDAAARARGVGEHQHGRSHGDGGTVAPEQRGSRVGGAEEGRSVQDPQRGREAGSRAAERGGLCAGRVDAGPRGGGGGGAGLSRQHEAAGEDGAKVDAAAIGGRVGPGRSAGAEIGRWRRART